MTSTVLSPDPAVTLLFGKGRRELLALLFSRPGESFYLRELARLTGASAGTAQRELRSLEAVGLITSHRRGSQRFFQSNENSPIFAALQQLLEQTMGAADLLRSALAPFADRLRLACIYGSLAKGSIGPSSDVDVLVVGTVEFSEITDAFESVEKRLKRPINSTVYSPEEFDLRLKEGRHFLVSVLGDELIPLIGEVSSDARRLARKRMAAADSGDSGGSRATARRSGAKPR